MAARPCGVAESPACLTARWDSAQIIFKHTRASGDRVIIGIDLGTTNCACAIYRNGAIEMIPNSLGHVLTPSAVSVDDDKKIITGLPARERQATHPDRTVTSFKRYMGARHISHLDKFSFAPEELSALMLRSLKADAEAYLGET